MYLPRIHSLGLRYVFVICTIVAVILVANFIYSNNFFYQSEYIQLRDKAEALTDQFVAMRAFMALNQDRINYDSEGNFEFKYLNPAAMGKGVGDILNEKSSYSIKQTRLVVRNPENAPDAYELEALQRFAADPGLNEIFSATRYDGTRVFRYIIPLYAEPACLACHGDPAGSMDVAGYPKEGLQEGELAGAISLMIPMDLSYQALARNQANLLVFSLIVLIATIASVLFVTAQMVARPLDELTQRAVQVGQGNLNVSFSGIQAHGEVSTLAREFSAMVETLKDLYLNMERKVSSRTRDLEAANLRLREGQKMLTQLNQKLSENSRLKSEFMATITHELKTPLTSIVAFCELMLDEASGPLNEEQRENMLDIRTSSQQLMFIISDILDMAKFEAGHLRLDKEKVDLNDVFRVVRRTMSAIAYQNNIRLDVRKVDVPLVFGDPERIRQMVNNLVSNAIKYTKENGQIAVYAQQAGEFAAITVEDTGEGIAPELLPHIFEKFRQGEESLKRKRGGTGLGLALVKTLAELQDGYISVISELGQGTKFTIYIPFAKIEGGDRDE
jgi:two-component system, NarL family, sensor histidine kinase BarA